MSQVGKRRYTRQSATGKNQVHVLAEKENPSAISMLLTRSQLVN
jgi:hypothetical protein